MLGRMVVMELENDETKNMVILHENPCNLLSRTKTVMNKFNYL